MKGRLLLLVVSSIFVGEGCNDSTGVPDDSNDNPAWLVRAEIPDNDFKPAQIEDAIDNIVDAVNRQQQDAEMKLSFIPKALDGYFRPIVEGANDAFIELGVVHTVVAPVPPDGSTDIDLHRDLQISYIEEHTADSYDGISLAPFGSELIPGIDAAVDKGITVITFDSDEPNSKRQLYVGTINTEAGRTAGETMATQLEAKSGIVVILGNTNEAWTDGIKRTQEAENALEENGFTVVVQNSIWEDGDSNVEALKETLLSTDEVPVGCLGLFANAHACAVAAEEGGIIDDIVVVAFDLEPQTLELMEEGKIQVTHVQRQYYMGYIVPYLLYASNVLGETETKSIISEIMVDDYRIDTGLDVVAADKIEEYTKFLDSLGVF